MHPTSKTGNDGDDENDNETSVSAGTAATSVDKVDKIVLTVIASGVSRFGHKRSRLKMSRDELSKHEGNDEDIELAKSYTKRLSEADIAEDFSKPEVLHSLSDANYKQKLDVLIEARMPFPCTCAIEVTNRKNKSQGVAVVSGNEPLGDFMNRAVTWLPEKDDSEDARDIGDQPVWDPENPVQNLIPSTISSKTARFEGCVSTYLVNPLLKSISGADGLERKQQLLTEIERFCLNQPADLHDDLQSSCADVVDTCRAIKFMLRLAGLNLN